MYFFDDSYIIMSYDPQIRENVRDKGGSKQRPL